VYFTFDSKYWNTDDMKERAPSTPAATGDYGISTDDYKAKEYAFAKDISDSVRRNSDSPLNQDRTATNFVTLKALLKQETTWVANFFMSGLWTTDLTGVAGAVGANEFLQWNDGDSEPIEVIRAQIDAILLLTGLEPNTLVLGKQVWTQLVDHPVIVDRIKYGQTAPGPARVTKEAVAELLEIDRILVMKSIVNSANVGQDASNSFIGGKAALLAYSEPNPGIETASAGYTFSWTSQMGATENGFRIKKYRRAEEFESDRVEGQLAFDMKLAAADLGAFFAEAVA
jgi:hypothetical protein